MDTRLAVKLANPRARLRMNGFGAADIKASMKPAVTGPAPCFTPQPIPPAGMDPSMWATMQLQQQMLCQQQDLQAQAAAAKAADQAAAQAKLDAANAQAAQMAAGQAKAQAKELAAKAADMVANLPAPPAPPPAVTGSADVPFLVDQYGPISPNVPDATDLTDTLVKGEQIVALAATYNPALLAVVGLGGAFLLYKLFKK